jgi:hypothetical protein
MKKLLIYGIAISLMGFGCSKKDDQGALNPSGVIVTKNMVINNNSEALNRRITLADNAPVYIFGNTSKETLRSSKGTAAPSVAIQLIAHLGCPEYNGEVLQASHIRIEGNYVYVAYNSQGPRYLGGVDVVKVTSPKNPDLISGVLFINQETNQGKDVSSIEVRDLTSSGGNATVWITGADEARDSAFAERYELNSAHQFGTDQPLNFSLMGYVGTDIRLFNDKVYVTSGTGGGLTVLDDQMKEVSFLSLTNARSVDINPDYEIVLGGDPGHLYNPGIWDKEIGGAGDPGAKSIVRLHGKFALVALGEEGLKCYDISSGTSPVLVSSLPRPVVHEGGDPADYVTNGVSVSESGWVYIANGANGLDVARLDDNGQLTWMGNIDLSQSANYVDANADYVFVATGLRGLKILKVTEN